MKDKKPTLAEELVETLQTASKKMQEAGASSSKFIAETNVKLDKIIERFAMYKAKVERNYKLIAAVAFVVGCAVGKFLLR